MERNVSCFGLGMHPPLPPFSRRVPERTSVEQSSERGERHEGERSIAVLYWHLQLGSAEILIGLTLYQTRSYTHEVTRKAAQGDSPDLGFSEAAALLWRNGGERFEV